MVVINFLGSNFLEVVCYEGNYFDYLLVEEIMGVKICLVFVI